MAFSKYETGEVRESALEISDLLEQYPKSKFVPKAKLYLGHCFLKLGDKETAKIYYKELISEFPKSNYSKLAKEKLTEFR